MYNTNSFKFKLVADKSADDEIALVPAGNDPLMFFPANLPIDLTWGDRVTYEAGDEASYAVVFRNIEAEERVTPSLICVDYLDPDDLPKSECLIPSESIIEAVESGLKTMYSNYCEITRMGIDLAPADLSFSTVSESDFKKTIAEWARTPYPNKDDINRSMLRDARNGVDHLGIVMTDRFGIPVGENCRFSISGDFGYADLERSSGGEVKISVSGHPFGSRFLEYSLQKEDRELLVKDIPISPYGIAKTEGRVLIYTGSSTAFGKNTSSDDIFIYASCGSYSEMSNIIAITRLFDDPHTYAALTKTFYGWLYISYMMTGVCSVKEMYPFKLLRKICGE